MNRQRFLHRTAFFLPRLARAASYHLLIALAILSVAAVGGGIGVWWLWPREPTPEPPAVDLAGVDPAIAAAVEVGRTKVRQSPRSADAWGQLGMILAAHDFAAAALACFAEAERLDRQEPRWLHYQGVALSLSDPAAALPKLRRAVALCGDDPIAPRLLLADVLLGQGRFDEAAGHYRHLLERNPRNAWAHLGLARVAVAEDRPQDSLDDLHQAAASQYCSKAAHTLLAQVQRRLGNTAAATAELRRAADLPDDPPWPDPFVEAIEELQIGENASLKRAARLINQNRIAEGVRLLRQTTRDYPQSYGVWLMLGQGLLKGQDLADAEQALRQAVRLAPTPVDAQYYLGATLLERGETRAATDCFREVVRLKPDHALAHYQLGHCLVLLEDRAGAIGAFRDALRARPDFADAHANLGKLLLESGQRAEALDHLRQAVDLDSAIPNIHQLLEQAR
jgi:tetratricopeptide (TPR) repeat protein